MKSLRRYIDKIKPHFEKGGKFEKLESTFEAFETFLFVSDKVTSKGTHVRDANDMKRTMAIVVFALVVLFLAFKFVGLFDSDKDKKDNNLLLQTLTPVEEVKAFINDIGSSDLKSAYGRQKNEVWHDYNTFCSNAFYGEIDSIHINNYSLKTSDSLEALVYAEYSLYCKDGRSGRYEKNFTLQIYFQAATTCLSASKSGDTRNGSVRTLSTACMAPAISFRPLPVLSITIFSSSEIDP